MAQGFDRGNGGRTGWILPLVIGGITGSLSSIITLHYIADLTPDGTTYLDLAAVLLAGAGVLIAVLGVGFALAAFWGFGELKDSTLSAAAQAAETAGVLEVKEQIENGPFRAYMEQKLEELIESPQMERQIRQQFARYGMGNPELDDDLDQDAHEVDVIPIKVDEEDK